MAVRKKAAKSSTKAKVAKKSTTKAKAPAKPVKVSDAFTKSELYSVLAERTELTKKQVGSVFEELSSVIEAHVKKSGPGKFTVPGLMKVVVRKVAAKKARKGINPFTGEETMFKAKPASRKVKIMPLKALKEMSDK